jgi:transcriptional regulator with XRE-family HTH domain
LPEYLGRFIRERREQLGLSPTAAARLAGIPYWRWIRLEKGDSRRPPDPEVARRVAGVLACTLAQFYAAAGVDQPAPDADGER